MTLTKQDIKILCHDTDRKYLYKCMKKMYTAQQQLTFMNKCRAKNLIPRGISNQCRFTLSYENPELLVLINSMFQTTKSRFFDLRTTVHTSKTQIPSFISLC